MDKSFFAKVQQLLLHKKKKVEEEIKNVEEDDPVLMDGLAESSEPGTDSWRTDAHIKLTAVKQTLEGALKRITKALSYITLGKYGKCEKCGKVIEKERLEAMPEAILCISCSKKAAR